MGGKSKRTDLPEPPSLFLVIIIVTPQNTRSNRPFSFFAQSITVHAPGLDFGGSSSSSSSNQTFFVSPVSQAGITKPHSHNHIIFYRVQAGFQFLEPESCLSLLMVRNILLLLVLLHGNSMPIALGRQLVT